ncbi:hypothetical protein [Niabella beijingensis]|uniref:hypothetical protein n=1 Tax=Niabella beijingensis TaxID=2872700 RepID=UPI001CC12C50|nr:hypothetical protein [Niabella beijingensis]MBZ4190590.1 hypothetical protein [Niabella beijingensis]
MKKTFFKVKTFATLLSLNREFQPYTVPAADILEIWQFCSYETKQFPEPVSDLQYIGENVKEILSELGKFKKKA